ncbi:hypothetical protein GXM_03802 [Nostoc sphaeroides CCNUC1]|uniref:Uncharacterized protein n=1 Tax=Nostoc sphaeroides CCNUC1 TaxID=2653204 RepID=A0A5P8W150_9NOSO|nr:hypothetical protein GXM_03802 [Nostoc sphaeroides CCNUC1]
MNFSETQQIPENVGFRSSTQPTLELFFRLNRTVLPRDPPHKFPSKVEIFAMKIKNLIKVV